MLASPLEKHGVNMLLKDWFYYTGNSQTEFARKLGITKQHLCGISLSRRKPSPKLALKIEEYTEGTVSAEELMFPEKFTSYPTTIKKPNKEKQ